MVQGNPIVHDIAHGESTVSQEQVETRPYQGTSNTLAALNFERALCL